MGKQQKITSLPYPSFNYYAKAVKVKQYTNEDIKYGVFDPFQSPIIDKHLKYFVAIREIYKDRENPLALEHVIELCNRDINLIVEHGTKLTTKYFNYESFHKLSIIYEKRCEYELCINVCQKAIDVMKANPSNPFNNVYPDYFLNKINKIRKKHPQPTTF